jgi:hypothetical protein
LGTVPGMNQGKLLMKNTPWRRARSVDFHLFRNSCTVDYTCSDTSRNP